MSKKAKYIIVILAALFLIGIIAVNVRKAPQGQPEQQSQSTDAAAAQSESEPAAADNNKIPFCRHDQPPKERLRSLITQYDKQTSVCLSRLVHACK